MKQVINGNANFLYDRNVLFFYGGGISLGVLGSVLLIFFIFSRFVPWKVKIYIIFSLILKVE